MTSIPGTADHLSAILKSMGEKPAPGLTRYRVTVAEWCTYRIILDAMSGDEAEGLAREIWEELGTEHFSFKENGVDGVTADEA